MTVEIFVDASCRYSHYGLVTIRRVLDELAADPAVPAFRPGWRFLRLHDLEPPDGLSRIDYGARRGQSPEDVDEVSTGIRRRAAAEGVRTDPSRDTFVENPLLAHRLLAMCRDDPGTDAPELWVLAFTLWSAKCTRGVRLDDPAALRLAAEDGGLEVPARIWERLADPEDHLAETLADRAYALSVGLDGVPRLRIDGTIVPMWHPFTETMELVRAALPASVATGG